MSGAAKMDPTIDTRRGTVYVWSKGGAVPDRLQHCLRRDMHIDARKYALLGDTAPLDFYIVSSLSATVEREAGRHNAIPVVLPAATVWLAARIDEITATGRDVSIAYRKPPQ